MKKKLVVSLLFFILTKLLFAQSDSICKLFIVDSVDTSPLSYTTVTITSIETKDTIGVYIADSSGIVQLNLPVGKALPVLLYGTRIGYFQKIDTLYKWGNRKLYLKKNEQYIQTVIVTATTVGRDVDKLNYKLDKAKIPEGTKITRIIKDVPLLSYNLMTGVTYKGFQDVIVKYNGKIISLDVLRTLVADNVGSIEVISNPSATQSSGTESRPIINLVVKKSLQRKQGITLGLLSGINQPLLFPSLTYNLITPKLAFTWGMSDQISIQKGKSNSYRLNKVTHENIFSNSTNFKAKLGSFSTYTSAFYDIDSTNQISASLEYANDKVKYNTSFKDQFISNVLNGRSDIVNKTGSVQTGIGYIKKLKKLSSLSFDVDFSNIQKDNSNNISNLFSNSDVDSDTYNFFNITTKNNYSFKTLYSGSIFGGKTPLKLEGEYLVLKSKNSFSSSFSGSDYLLATTFLNQFQYSFSGSTKFQKNNFSTRFGLRYEYLFQEITNENQKIHFSNLFPNIVFLYKINKSNTVFLNYQRKINRPDISILNSARYKYGNADEYNGNLFIKPEYINKYDLNLDINKKNIFVEVTAYTNYSRNPIAYRTVITDKITSYSYINIKDLLVGGLSLSNKISFSDKLKVNSTIFAERYRFSDEYKLPRLNGYTWGGVINTNYDITDNYSVSLDFSYRNRSYGYQNITLKRPDFDITLEGLIFNEKLLVGVAINNILNSAQRTESIYEDNTYLQVRNSKSQSRMFMISLSYTLGRFLNSKQRAGGGSISNKSADIAQ